MSQAQLLLNTAHATLLPRNGGHAVAPTSLPGHYKLLGRDRQFYLASGARQFSWAFKDKKVVATQSRDGDWFFHYVDTEGRRWTMRPEEIEAMQRWSQARKAAGAEPSQPDQPTQAAAKPSRKPRTQLQAKLEMRRLTTERQELQGAKLGANTRKLRQLARQFKLETQLPAGL